MLPITYSWIGLSAASPLIFLLCAWVLGVFHSFRRQWRSVDLFLLAIFAQELLTALQVFVYALLSLTSPDSSFACAIFVWSLSATRTLQAVTVTSMLVDRALTSQWPYKYRFSVRRHQIRYHLVVLAAMAALVGVAALLARPSDSISSFGECTFLPHNLHVRLSLFLLSLFGIFLIISTVSVAVVQSTRGCFGGPENSDMSPITHGTATSSTTTSSVGGGRAQHTNSTASTTSSTTSGRIGGGLFQRSTQDLVGPPLRPYHGGRMGKGPSRLALSGSRHPTVDFRWSASLVVAILCFGINHLPYMALVILGTFFPSVVPAWPLENLSLWLSLAEGFILPMALAIADQTFATAVVFSCSREATKQNHKFDDSDGTFRLNFAKDDAVKSFPLTNGSLFSSLLNMNLNAAGLNGGNMHHHIGRTHKVSGVGLRMGLSNGEIRDANGQIGHSFGHQLLYGSSSGGGASSLGSIGNSSHDPIYSDPLNKACSLGSSLELIEEDHIYATLSETFGSLSSLSDEYLSDHHRCSSATTVANDDFEYHRPKSNQIGQRVNSFATTISSNSSRLGINRQIAQNRLPIIHQTNYKNKQLFDSLQKNKDSVKPVACPRIAAKDRPVVPHRPPAKLPSEVNPSNQYFGSSSDLIDSTDSSDSSPASSFRSLSSSTESSDSAPLTQTYKNMMPQTTITTINHPIFEGGFVNEAFTSDTLDKKSKIEEASKDQSLEQSIKLSMDTLNKVLDEYSDTDLVSTDKEEPPINDGTLTRKHRASSLSMNDLDRLDSKDSTDIEEEMMFILPVKSESMLSLYKLYLAEDEPSGTKSLHYSVEVSETKNDLASLTVQKSESDSCIGVQSQNRKHISHDIHNAEIYQKSKMKASSSRVKRQNKIQRAKGVHYNRNRPVVIPEVPQTSSCRSVHPCRRPDAALESPYAKNIRKDSTANSSAPFANKLGRRNGIITISDPSVLSVEELFKVLDRASVTDEANKNKMSIKTQDLYQTREDQDNLNGTEYKKIFVSEYI